MNIFINITLITIIVVFIIDLSGIISEIERKLQILLKTNKSINIKPFSCSLCMAHHINFIYLLFNVNNHFLLYWCYICILAFLTPIIKDLLITIKELISKLINYIS